MFVLDKDKILRIARETKSNGNTESQELLAILGGDALNEVFDSITISSIIKSIIQNGVVHELCDGNGLDIIEGLLNRKITGNMGKFYNIKPEYILSLSSEEQIKMAQALSEGNTNLERLLVLLWSKSIVTMACGGKSENAYLSLGLPISDVSSIGRIKNVSAQEGNSITITKFGNNLHLLIKGSLDTLYINLLNEFQNDVNLDDRFLSAILEAIQFETELLYPAVNKQGFSDEEVEALLEENVELYRTEIEDLNRQLETEKAKYSDMRDRFMKVRTFIITKLGRVPLLGRIVINLLEKDLGQNALESDTIQERE